MTRNNGQARYGYVYEGLTRADPTLQVYSALVQRSAASTTVTLENVDLADPNRYVIFGFSSPDGRYAYGTLGDSGTVLQRWFFHTARHGGVLVRRDARRRRERRCAHRPDGFLDEYSLVREASAGPSRGHGYFTESQRRAYVMGTD